MRRLALALAVLSGCTGGSGDLPQDTGLSEADWIEVDLANGAVTAVAGPSIRALAQARWRSSHVLFRRIPAASASSDGQLLPGGGETEDSSASRCDGRSFLAVFELTEAQWAVMNGRSDGSDLPLTGIPAEDLAVAVAGMRLSRFRCALPDAGLWALGCNAGQQTLFAWGDGLAEAAASTYAVHHPPSASAPSVPAAVGSLLPNALGLYDMHGNVWEAVLGDGGYQARGGAWDSPVMQCRTANVVDLPADLAVPMVGVRLALIP